MAPEPAPDLPIVLVIEDSDLVLNVIRTLLLHLRSLVIEAPSCKAALLLAAETPHIDLVIADFSLPDGFATTILFDLAGRFPGLKIIVTSGTSISEWPGQALLDLKRLPVECVWWLSKPFTATYFLDAVREVLKKNSLEGPRSGGLIQL
jgi:CheY-like chemotaxis protein